MRLEPITDQPSVPKVIVSTPVNGEIQIHAERFQSFKTTLSRVNNERKKGAKKIEFSYSGIVDNYYTATRIS